MIGRARDIYTPEDRSEPAVLATGEFRISVSDQREMLAVDLSPPHRHADRLRGVRGGKASRAALRECMGDIEATPLYQLLDDFAGASLVAPWAKLLWAEQLSMSGRKDSARTVGEARPAQRNVCIGFAEGSSALLPRNATSVSDHCVSVTEVGNPNDLAGWHELPITSGPHMRRARRIDIRLEEGVVKVHAGFQDSGRQPSGGRAAVHEYRIQADIDQRSGVLLALDAVPHVLPFPECPAAAAEARQMIGKPVTDFRQLVAATLHSVLGCTHLNDVLRALADVSVLAAALPRQGGVE
ncbi:hypothetical protein BSL82_11860 [Tardibacter chloracetimidivorans]|uniref:DUF2889 domain-containing protein n=1 Tax=Tardibacter chloracetimidivorans TaxID=1921510 RepID=A0A1L3ZWD7_9SPHN|nr:DUF2889 domain-containing protein [Tardibacter chloracetimidivorans]API59919.1 hypothetical protein BSL82_11860 [Tardibacter chloracetimidivorans]